MKLFNKYARAHISSFVGVCSGCNKLVGVTLQSGPPVLVAKTHHAVINTLDDEWTCAGSGEPIDKFVNIPCWVCRALGMDGNVPAKGPARQYLVCCKHYRMFYR